MKVCKDRTHKTPNTHAPSTKQEAEECQLLTRSSSGSCGGSGRRVVGNHRKYMKQGQIRQGSCSSLPTVPPRSKARVPGGGHLQHEVDLTAASSTPHPPNPSTACREPAGRACRDPGKGKETESLQPEAEAPRPGCRGGRRRSHRGPVRGAGGRLHPQAPPGGCGLGKDQGVSLLAVAGGHPGRRC